MDGSASKDYSHYSHYFSFDAKLFAIPPARHETDTKQGRIQSSRNDKHLSSARIAASGGCVFLASFLMSQFTSNFRYEIPSIVSALSFRVVE